MTTTEALAAIGQPFKVKDLIGMPVDTIRQVTEDGLIIGDFTEALAEYCRFILPQPEHLKKYYIVDGQRMGSFKEVEDYAAAVKCRVSNTETVAPRTYLITLTGL